MDHNQERETILSETQNRTHILSKEVLSLKDEKTRQVSNLTCWQFKWGSWNPVLSLDVPMKHPATGLLCIWSCMSILMGGHVAK